MENTVHHKQFSVKKMKCVCV